MAKIERTRGDTYAIEYTVRRKSDLSAIDITGFSFLLTVDISSTPVDDSNNLFQIAGVITDAVNGVVEFRYTLVEADQEPGKYYFDVQLTDASGKIRTLEKDDYIIKQDITK